MQTNLRNPSRAVLLAVGSLAALCLSRAQTPAPSSVTLKDAAQGIFYVGVAIRPEQINGQIPQAAALITREFNCLTAENVMKMGPIHPRAGNEASSYNFEPADQLVEFGVKNKFVIIGHNLCWHSQMPGWMSQPDPGQETLTKEVLLERLRSHIMTVVGRYKGKVHGWDVVNEAINDGEGDYRQTVFYRIIGKEYLPLAFKWAHEADPAAELYYNDYNLDANDKKRATAIELVKYLREQGAVVHGIGMQCHYNMNGPSVAKIDETIRMFSELGLKVHVTELDVRAGTNTNATLTGAVPAGAPNPGRGERGPPPPLTEAQQEALATRYGEIFAVFLKHPSVVRVTFWGLRDADSWRRQDRPLIFDDAYGRKPAYDAVIRAIEAKRSH